MKKAINTLSLAILLTSTSMISVMFPTIIRSWRIKTIDIHARCPNDESSQ